MEQNTTTSLFFGKKKFPIVWIVYTTLLAGTLDITAAILLTYISSKHGPLIVLKYVASGVLGTDAFSGGLGIALMGLLLHYIIAFIWTVIFFLMFPVIFPLLKNKYVIALFYGIMVWAVMNLVVVPLSNTPAPKTPFNINKALINASILVLCIGLPLSLMANRYYGNKRK